ncbi:MAG: inosine/xanthosine triphosphatase [Candidatus Gracilibacteria bacterium]|nr:inosine/xanthosine triphosphatase [Candidatus Gracilibacteria bacterium]
MIIAIGTTRLPKVEGIKEGIKSCPYLNHIENIEYILEKSDSNISDMPLSIDEIILGAKNRSQNMKKSGIVADFYIGIEGGTTKIGNKKYIGGVVYIENKEGKGHYGISAMMEVPDIIEDMLYNKGLELGPVMGELSGKTDIRSENGSMGAWSNDMFTRIDEFATAFKAAICPFYNDYYKM